VKLEHQTVQDIGLYGSPGKAVKEETSRTGILRYRLFDDLDDDLVGHQPS